MKLSLTDLAILIELLEIQQNSLFKEMNDPETPEDIADANAETLVQMGNTAGTLKYLYESGWVEGCNHDSYDQVVSRVEEN